jgi:hypothetical protein
MTLSRKNALKFLGILIILPLLMIAQEKKDDPLENFDGSKAESTQVDPDTEKTEDPGSGKISLGELSEDQIKQDKMTESLENELESENAKGDEVDALIRSAIESMQPALSASGLELNQAEVFPADI